MQAEAAEDKVEAAEAAADAAAAVAREAFEAAANELEGDEEEEGEEGENEADEAPRHRQQRLRADIEAADLAAKRAEAVSEGGTDLRDHCSISSAALLRSFCGAELSLFSLFLPFFLSFFSLQNNLTRTECPLIE